MTSPIRSVAPLGFPWVTADPFLFCVHHLDHYPPGNEQLGPAASLAGRDLGMDFAGKDGWRMYHGHTVPGFPAHPHRGFETVTVVRRGLIDHADSLGAAARFGRGDAQWVTAGAGIVHSEMFPLLDREHPNTFDFFQIWLNLPSADKMAPPHFAMLWRESVPRLERVDAQGRRAVVTVVAGAFEGERPPPPPPRSWASREEADVAIWTIDLEPGATITLPPVEGERTQRTLYFYEGDELRIGDHGQSTHGAIAVHGDRPLTLEAGSQPVALLMLQGRPIGEPVAQHGPFVMNHRAELVQAFVDYQETRFGGWPWESDAPVHPREEGRFARHADGRVERMPG